MKKSNLLILFLPLLLGGCVMNNGLPYNGKCQIHMDEDNDHRCDNCGKVITNHVDNDGNDKCDICNLDMPRKCSHHVDNNGDGYCDVCSINMGLPAGSKVTTYLVLSSVGLYKGEPGTNFEELNLEYTIKFEGKVGDPLPGKDEITHKYGNCVFTSWQVYEGKGAPTVYTTVPSVDGKILYACFVSTGSDPVVPDTDDETKTTYSLKTNFDNGEGDWSVDDPSIYAYCWNDTTSNHYLMNKVGNSYYSFSLENNPYKNILFVRLPSGESFDWSKAWNQTSDLAFESGRKTAQITCWDDGAGKCGVKWVA